MNDNAPVLPVIQPITVPAGDGKRKVVRVQAADNDEGKDLLLVIDMIEFVG